MEDNKQHTQAALNLWMDNDKAAREKALASLARFQQAEVEKLKRFKEIVASTIGSWK